MENHDYSAEDSVTTGQCCCFFWEINYPFFFFSAMSVLNMSFIFFLLSVKHSAVAEPSCLIDPYPNF